ncbi:MAG: hypothetical protein [Betabaculovirus sp.]|nr:MAG: hypothetical protein [Betabaculovirus sp.]
MNMNYFDKYEFFPQKVDEKFFSFYLTFIICNTCCKIFVTHIANNRYECVNVVTSLKIDV